MQHNTFHTHTSCTEPTPSLGSMDGQRRLLKVPFVRTFRPQPTSGSEGRIPQLKEAGETHEPHTAEVCELQPSDGLM